MAAHPATVECRTVFGDGRQACITATRRPRAERAEVKCIVPGGSGAAQQMQAAVRLARLSEGRFDSREQVVLSMDLAPPAGERGWELCAVLADRMVRGAWRPARLPVTAIGHSDAWQQGVVQGTPAAAWPLAQQGAADGALWLGGVADDAGAPWAAHALPHLAALDGQACAAAGVSSARAWFPLHSGGVNDCLAWIEVSVAPLSAQEALDEEDTIAAPQLNAAEQRAVRQVLAGARHFDGHALGRWQTAVRFGQPHVQGESWQLALVMADRLARGREWGVRGRLIASGRSGAWHAGRVETVEGAAPKLALILAQAGAGDRILLPRAWEALLPEGYRAALAQKGASMACLAGIGRPQGGTD